MVDPITLGTIIVGSLTTNAAVIAVVGIVANLTIAAILGKILAPSFSKSAGKAGKGTQVNRKSNIEPRKVIYGEAIVGGPFMIMETFGSVEVQDTRVHNSTLQMIIALSGHPVDDILGVMIGDEYIDISDGPNDLDSNYWVNTGPYRRRQLSILGADFDVGLVQAVKVKGWAYADKSHVNDETTHSEVASDQTRAEFIADELQAVWDVSGLTRDSDTGLWEASGDRNKLTNCSYVFLKLNWNKEYLTSLPQIRFHVYGKRLYNPYQDSTNMLSYGATSGGTHDLFDVDTREWSQDWTLCALDYLINDEYGLGATSDPNDPLCEIDWEEAIDSFLVSQTTVTHGYTSPNIGSGPRYTTNGAFLVDATPISLMEALLTSGAGELIYSQGKYKLRPGIYRPPASPDDIINEDMIVSPLAITTHASRSQIFNKVSGVFLDRGYTGVPSSTNLPLFEPSDFPLVNPLDSSGVNPYEIEDGEEIIAEYDFPFTIRSFEAQRLARILLERVRRGFTVQFEGTLELLKYSVGDTVYLEILSNSKYANEAFYNRLGLDDSVQTRPDSPQGAYYKQFKILEMSYTEDFKISVVMIEEAEEIYDWNDGYASFPPGALVSDLVVDDWRDVILPPVWDAASPYSVVTETVSGTDIITQLRWAMADRGSSQNALDGAHVSSYEVQFGIITDVNNSVPQDRVAEWLSAGIHFQKHEEYTQGPAVLTNLYINPTTDYDFRVRSNLVTGRQSDWAYYSVDQGTDFTPSVPFGSSRYYILPVYGTTIHNQTGLITLQAREVTSAGDNLLSSGTIRLYEADSPYQEITVANGYTSPSDGFTATLDYQDINGDKVIVLSDGAPPGGTILDSVTVTDITDGTLGNDAVVAYLSVSSPYVVTDENGENYTYFNPSSEMRLFEGQTEVTAQASYSIVGSSTLNGLTISISDSSPTHGEISFSGASWTSERETFTVRATYNAVDYDLPITMSKVNKGVPGRIIYLTSEADVISANNDGTGYTLPGNPVSIFKIFDNNIEVTSSSTFSVNSPDTVDGLTAFISSSSPTHGEISLSGASWTGNEASFTFTGTYDGQQFEKIYTISKSLEGAVGADGSDAITINYTNDSHAVPVTNAGAETWTGSGGLFYAYDGGTVLTLNTNTQTGDHTGLTNGEYNLDITKVSGDTLTEPTITGETTTTASLGEWAGDLTTLSVYRINAYIQDNGGTQHTLTLDVSLSPADQGTDGAAGADGDDAFVVNYTNNSHAVTVTNLGVEEWSGSGGDLFVFEGATLLTLDTNTQTASYPSATSSYNLDITQVSGNSLTEPAITGQGTTTATLADWAGNLTTVTVYKISIYIHGSGGQQATHEVYATLSPAHQGNNGATGDPGQDGGTWNHTLVFTTPSPGDNVDWSAGTLYTIGTPGGISISTGNTGSMTVGTSYYIYYDEASPTDELSTTTTASTAVGTGKILIAVARINNTDDPEPFFQVFGGNGGILIGADEIAANSIVANKIAASFYTGRQFTGGIFQTRVPSDTSPYPTTTRAVLQGTDPYFGIYTNDGTGQDIQIFGITDVNGEARIFIEGDFVAGSLDTAQMYSSAGITDLRGRLGVTAPASPTGGITTLTNIPQTLNGAASSEDFELDVDTYNTGLDVNSFTVSITDYGMRSGSSSQPYTAPVWDLNFFYTDSLTSPITWTQVPGADWTITGTTSNVLYEEFDPDIWINEFFLSATKQVDWTPTSPFAASDPIYFMIRADRISGDYNNPRLTACNVSEPVSGTESSFGTITVTDTDSGYTWTETGSAVATGHGDTTTFVSGTGINIDVDAGSDAIRITSSAGGGNVSNTGTPVNNQIAVWTDATTIEGDSTFTWDGNHLLLNKTANEPTTPTLAFGDGDSGFFEGIDDAIYISLGGTTRYILQNAYFNVSQSSGAALVNEVPSATNPVFSFTGDLDTGIGRSTADELSIVSGGVEMMRFVEGTADYTSTNHPIFIGESSNDLAAIAGYGQIWVRTESNGSRLYYTDDVNDTYPVGMGAYNLIANQSYNMTTDANAQSLVNGAWYSDNATAYTLTLEPSTDTEFPVGAQMTVWNEGSGTLTINEGTGDTLYLLTGSAVTDTAGGCTMAQGGYATIIRKTAATWLIMGAGITA